MCEDIEHTIKLIVIGDSAVGKSAMMATYVGDDFPATYVSTVGVDFKLKHITLDDKPVRVQMWDTAGQERFRSIVSSYYRGAHGFILVYDVCSEKSFDSVDKWIREIEKFGDREAKIVLIGNKIDMYAKRLVLTERGQAKASELGIDFFEVSAKTGHNLETAINSLLHDTFYLVQTKSSKSQIMQKMLYDDKKERKCNCW